VKINLIDGLLTCCSLQDQIPAADETGTRQGLISPRLWGFRRTECNPGKTWFFGFFVSVFMGEENFFVRSALWIRIRIFSGCSDPDQE
jgi:hypothetical protein